MDHRKAAKVFPDPVGATINVSSPRAMAAHPAAWAGVGSRNRWENQPATTGWKRWRDIPEGGTAPQARGPLRGGRDVPGDPRAWLHRARVGHLATADRCGRPSVVPVCFALDGSGIVIALDEKPKRVRPRQLRRVRNIQENPHVALVVDHYEEDWRRLRYVLVLGTAELLDPGTSEHAAALRRLRRKYPQYRAMRLEERPAVRITPHRVVAWAARHARGLPG